MGSEVDWFMVVNSCWNLWEATSPAVLCHPYRHMLQAPSQCEGVPSPPHLKQTVSLPVSKGAAAWPEQGQGRPHGRPCLIISGSHLITHSLIQQIFSEYRSHRQNFCPNHEAQSHEDCMMGHPNTVSFFMDTHAFMQNCWELYLRHRRNAPEYLFSVTR